MNLKRLVSSGFVLALFGSSETDAKQKLGVAVSRSQQALQIRELRFRSARRREASFVSFAKPQRVWKVPRPLPCAAGRACRILAVAKRPAVGPTEER